MSFYNGHELRSNLFDNSNKQIGLFQFVTVQPFHQFLTSVRDKLAGERQMSDRVVRIGVQL